jgi:hypothetical protein
MGFQFAGSLSGSAPIVRRFQIGTTMYVGCLVQPGLVNVGLGGHVDLLEVATAAAEGAQPIVGMVSAVADESRTYVPAVSETAGYGDRSTYSTTMADITANNAPHLTGGGEVDVTLALPMDTLIRAPIYNTTWGNALTEQVVTSADTNGVSITATGDAIATMTAGFMTAYCRSGANRGHSRIVTTATSTTVSVVAVPFPYTIAVDDVFVVASCALGYSGMDVCTASDAIDGNKISTYYYLVYYHEVNLEESGKEYAVFSTTAIATAPAT